MNKYRSWGLGLVAALILAGCKQQIVVTVVVTKPPRVVTPMPTIGDIVESFPIVICLPNEPKTLNPYASSSLSEHEVLASISQGWLKDITGYIDYIFEGGEFPSFANGEMIASGQGVEITLKFSHEMRWSDYTPFTVDDLLLTYDYLTSEELQSKSVSIEKVDDYTLSVVYQGDSISELDILSEVLSNLTPPLPSHIRKEGTSTREFFNSYYSDLPAPTLGPFGTDHSGEWVRGDHITLRAIENWRSEILTPQIIFLFFPNVNERLAATLSGECDYSMFYQPSESLIDLVQNVTDRGLVNSYLDPSPVPARLDVYSTDLCGVDPHADRPAVLNVNQWYFTFIGTCDK